VSDTVLQAVGDVFSQSQLGADIIGGERDLFLQLQGVSVRAIDVAGACGAVAFYIFVTLGLLAPGLELNSRIAHACAPPSSSRLARRAARCSPSSLRRACPTAATLVSLAASTSSGSWKRSLFVWLLAACVLTGCSWLSAVHRDGVDNSSNFNSTGLNCVDLTGKGLRKFIRFTFVRCFAVLCVVIAPSLFPLDPRRFFSFDQSDFSNITVSRSVSCVMVLRAADTLAPFPFANRSAT
jgi:hypothetical protein